MKKIVASVGLVALGASSINAALGQDISSAPSKSWNVSASLRGFYDDNINTTSTDKTNSMGFTVQPGVGLNWGNDQTSVQLGYLYSFRYYDKKPAGNTEHYDQDHTFEGAVRHAFNERYRISVGESFALGQEPDLLRIGTDGFVATPQRIPGDNYRNYGTVVFNAQLTPLLGLEVGYANEYNVYADSGASTNSALNPGVLGKEVDGEFIYGPTRAGLMNRMGNTFRLEGQYQFSPQTVGLVGYEFGMMNYTGDEQIGNLDDLTPVYSDNRNTYSHKLYVGADHVFRPDLSGSVKVGATLTDYYNDPGNQTHVSPYFKGSLRYTYTVESYGELGFNYDRSATDVLTVSGDGITQDSQAFIVYGSIYQRLARNFYGSLLLQLQNSTFYQGSVNGENELYYTLGLNLNYRFTPNLSANAGYNYDKLDSNAQPFRNYDRNRVYVGVTATY